MAPHKPSQASPSSPVLSSASSAPPAAEPAAVEEYKYQCTFCGKGTNNRHAISGHYNLHRRLPQNTYVLLGPEGSRVRQRILLARNEAREYQYKRMGWARARARSLSSEPVRAIQPPHARPQLPRFGPMGRAGFSTALARMVGRWEPVILRETGPRAHFRETGPVARAQGPVGFPMRKDVDVAGPSSSAGSEAAADFDPPPGFGHVLTDLNFPASSNMRPVKREIIIID